MNPAIEQINDMFSDAIENFNDMPIQKTHELIASMLYESEEVTYAEAVELSMSMKLDISTDAYIDQDFEYVISKMVELIIVFGAKYAKLAADRGQPTQDAKLAAMRGACNQFTLTC